MLFQSNFLNFVSCCLITYITYANHCFITVPYNKQSNLTLTSHEFRNSKMTETTASSTTTTTITTTTTTTKMIEAAIRQQLLQQINTTTTTTTTTTDNEFGGAVAEELEQRKAADDIDADYRVQVGTERIF
jgi:hypothetical protein